MASKLNPRSIESRPETPSTRTFSFSVDDGGFDYEPGQYVAVKLEGVEDERGPQRPFTLSSSPTEQGQIRITSRMTGSPFKRALESLAEQDESIADRVRLRGPLGGFTLDPERESVMIAGGIGITPFRSMIRCLWDQGGGQHIVLLYSSTTPEDIVFRDELDTIAADAEWLDLVHTITEPHRAREKWAGRTGRIDTQLIADAADNLKNPLFYACGPPAMVSAMARIIEDQMRIPKADLRTEKFTGY